jgi:dTDP-4-amino-4,6-dideoxy-D-galactose acyltransferase
MQNITYDNWLSSIVQKDSYNLIVDDDLIGKSKQYGFSDKTWIRLLKRQKINKSIFVQTKVSTLEIGYIEFLEDLGFRLVDTNVILRKNLSNQQLIDHKYDIERNGIRFANLSDKDGAVHVGRNSFIYSRFHLDPLFPNALANKIKANWVSNYFDGKRGDHMVVALIKNKVVGFLQILKPKSDEFVIDLIGVSKEQQRKGIAQKMINFAIDNSKGVEYIIVGTQIGNIPSIKFYQKMGFFMVNAKYVFHFHG